MGMNEMDILYEKKRLEETLEHIKNCLDENQETFNKFDNYQISAQRSMWQNVPIVMNDTDDFDKLIETQQYLDQIRLTHSTRRLYDTQIRKLEKMSLSAYFGRIDFKEDDFDDIEQIYIGISSLENKDTMSCIVYDWRTPIASMFYDCETGKASYSCPIGIISGDLSLKRQYKIFRNNIEYMFDSSLKIDDEILQEMLSKNVDDKMKTIVTTIQQEQNKIIRDDLHPLLIVQGAAGSGKTSIALHRIAYLLYRDRNSVKAENIVIFSPNEIFNDYISDVLPELGEENMCQTTFKEFTFKYLDEYMKKEDMNSQMEYIFSEKSTPDYEARIAAMKYKASKDFSEVLKNYGEYLTNNCPDFEDLIANDKILISKDELTKLFCEDYSHFPLLKKMLKIHQRFAYVIKPYEAERIKELEKEIRMSGEYDFEHDLKPLSRLALIKELEPVRERLRELTSIDIYEAYKKLFNDKTLLKSMAGNTSLPDNIDDISDITIKYLENGQISYEDSAPLLYLKCVVGEIPSVSSINHVVIDEVQDYTPVQFETLKLLFPYSSMTLVGDLNQSINPYMNVGGYENIIDIYSDKNKALLKLSKSYRSTKEISDFYREILLDKDATEFVNRCSKKPKVITYSDKTLLYDSLLKDISKLHEEGFKSIALICKTVNECIDVYMGLDSSKDIKLLSNDDIKYSTGTVILPSYLSKGLEFDAVIVIDADESTYGEEDDRNLFYTACSRALHRLSVYYSGEMCEFLNHIDKKLYKEIIL